MVKTEERVMEAREGTLAEVKAAKKKGEEVVLLGYENWHLPNLSLGKTWAALGVMTVGIVMILLLDKFGAKPGEGARASGESQS